VSGSIGSRLVALVSASVDAGEWRRGWPVVAGAAIGLGTGVSLYLMISSLFIKGVTTEFGWSRGDMARAGAVAFVVGAIALSLIGKLVDRVGFRRVVLVCAPAMALLYVFIALQPGSYGFYIALMVWGGVAGAGTGAIAYTRPVIGAFTKQRGLALGAATCGVSITSIVLSPLLALIIADHGWRAGLFALAVITAFVGLPLALALIQRGKAGGEAAARAVDEVRDAPMLHVPDVPIDAAVRTRAFWLLVVALMCVNVPGAGVVGQLAPLIGDKGLSEVAAGYVMSVYAFGILAGRLATGFALDHMRPSLVAGAMTLVPAAGMTLLLLPEPSFALAAFAVLLIGLQQGSEVDLLAFFVSRRFGVLHYGAIYGRIATFGALGTAVGLVLFGEVFDATGAYTWALMIGAAAFAAGAAAFAGIGDIRR
jgi:MFS family permease